MDSSLDSAILYCSALAESGRTYNQHVLAPNPLFQPTAAAMLGVTELLVAQLGRCDWAGLFGGRDCQLQENSKTCARKEVRHGRMRARIAVALTCTPAASPPADRMARIF
jgi:hypothetical protein